MKYRVWIILVLTVCLLCGCGPAQMESKPETTAPASDPTTAPTTVPVETKPVYKELAKTKVEAEAEIFKFPPAEMLWSNPYGNDSWLTFLVETRQELVDFWEENRYPTEGYITDAPSYQEAVGEYDDAFFETKSLVVVFIYSGSGSFRYGLQEMYKEPGGSLYVEVDFLNDSTAGTCDMQGWLLVCAVDKKDLEDVTDYHSYTVNVPLWEMPAQPEAQERIELPLNSTLCVFRPHDPELIRWGGLSNPTDFPTYRVDSLQELEDFRNTYGMPGQMDATWEEVVSFQDAVASYDDAYFAQKSLILTYIRLGTHQERYQLNSLYTSGDGLLTVEMVMPEGDYGSDTDIANWLLVTQVEKSALQNVTDYASGVVRPMEMTADTVHVGSTQQENVDFYSNCVPSIQGSMIVHRLESLQQLETFQLRYGEDFDFGSHEEGLCFVKATEGCDEAFFRENDLLIVYYTTPAETGFVLDRVTVGHRIHIQLREEAGGKAGGWFMLLPIPKTVTQRAEWYYAFAIRYTKEMG